MNEIRRDLSRKLQIALADVLTREANLADAVLERADVAILFVEAAVMMGQSAAASVAGWADNRDDCESLFNETYGAIVKQLVDNKGDALARTLAETKAAGR